MRQLVSCSFPGRPVLRGVEEPVEQGSVHREHPYSGRSTPPRPRCCARCSVHPTQLVTSRGALEAFPNTLVWSLLGAFLWVQSEIKHYLVS